MPQLDSIEDFRDDKAGDVWGFTLALWPRVVEYCQDPTSACPWLPVSGKGTPGPLEAPPSISVARGHTHCSVGVVQEGKACIDSLNPL